MNYCGWSTFCNKIILDSSTVRVGEGATIQENLESGGLKKTRLSCSNPPDQFNIVMKFDFSKKQSNGFTELENFYKWYKFTHKFGTVPFEFPAIILNSNRVEGYSQEELNYKKALNPQFTPDTEYYVITEALEGEKSGYDQQITMVWRTYAVGTIQVEDEEVTIDHIDAENGYVDVTLTDTPATEPSSGTWAVYVKRPGETEFELLTITKSFFDGEYTATLYFEAFTTAGEYTIKIGEKTDPFTVIAG